MKLLMVRHAEPDYILCNERGFIGHGHDLAPLTAKGVEQAERTALDERLKDAELIIASPYTRALQTAAILSRVTGIRIVVEMDLREWQPDLTFRYKDYEESLGYVQDYEKHNGEHPHGKKRKWEQRSVLKKRVITALEKYKGKYEKIIVVSHGMAMGTVCGPRDINHAEIVECEI